MRPYLIIERTVVLASTTLSTQHRSIGGKHYDGAISIARARTERDHADTIAWIRENVPSAPIEFNNIGESTTNDDVSSRISQLFKRGSSEREISETTFQVFQLVAVMPTDADVIAFRLRWD